MASALFVDTISIYNVGLPVTVGSAVTFPLTLVAANVPGLVQTTGLQSAAESIVLNSYSVKVKRSTALNPGMVVVVITSAAEPALVGQRLMVDKVSLNGLSMLRKAVALDYDVVNPQGREAL